MTCTKYTYTGVHIFHSGITTRDWHCVFSVSCCILVYSCDVHFFLGGGDMAPNIVCKHHHHSTLSYGLVLQKKQTKNHKNRQY